MWLDGCSGCHMSLLDVDEGIITIAQKADLVYSPLVDQREYPHDVDIAIVEGAVSSDEDLEKIRAVRQRTRIVVALGDCAITTNVTGMRNPLPLKAAVRRVYVDGLRRAEGASDRGLPDAAEALDTAARGDQDRPARARLSSIGADHPVRSHRASGGRIPDLQDQAALRLRSTPMKTIVIDPVTRIEGHAKITIHLDDDGHVADTQFHVTQIRGFEKFCEGRPYYEMPSITSRICGICPISHLIASAKACEAIMSVRVPPTAAKLREIMHCGQVIQSHALSFFHLSAPDLLLGFDCDPARRNIVGLIEDHPQLARDGIALRQFGQQVIEGLAGERVHPSWTVPGGVNAPLEIAGRDRILAALPEAKAIALRTLGSVQGHRRSIRRGDRGVRQCHQPCTRDWSTIRATCSSTMAIVRFIDAAGKVVVVDRMEAQDYRTVHRRGDGAAFVPEGAVFPATRLS